MKSLTAEHNYEKAAEIADTINWNKIKNVNALVYVAYLVGTHTGACVSSGLVAGPKICVNVDTVSVLALNGQMSLVKGRTNRTVIHYFFNDTDTHF